MTRTISRAPGVLHVRKLAHEAEFAQCRPANGHRGVYGSFEEAQRAVPPHQPIGYDHPEMAGLYREKLTSLDPADYPVLFWLRPALKGAKRVFDFGGHVGIAFYTYRHYLQWPADLTWTVCDVPAVVKAGESLAKSEGVGPQLRFTERVEEASGCDVLLALGAIQYMEPGFLPRTLERLEQRPRHVIVQRTPLHPTTSFVTLQATGLAFCPYAVANRGKMIDDLTKLGYELVDSWTQERSSEVPFHPELTVEHYAGLYFRLR